LPLRVPVSGITDIVDSLRLSGIVPSLLRVAPCGFKITLLLRGLAGKVRVISLGAGGLYVPHAVLVYLRREPGKPTFV